jgi:hypothetical protein
MRGDSPPDLVREELFKRKTNPILKLLHYPGKTGSSEKAKMPITLKNTTAYGRRYRSRFWPMSRTNYPKQFLIFSILVKP